MRIEACTRLSLPVSVPALMVPTAVAMAACVSAEMPPPASRKARLATSAGASVAMASSAVGHVDAQRFPGRIAGSRPATPGLWTVVARHAWRADALTKVAALAEPDAREGWVARLGGALLAPASSGPG